MIYCGLKYWTDTWLRDVIQSTVIFHTTHNPLRLRTYKRTLAEVCVIFKIQERHVC